jgi:protein phosphatase
MANPRVLVLPELELYCIVAGFGAAPALSACVAADAILHDAEAAARSHPGRLPMDLADYFVEDAIRLGHQQLRALGPPPNPEDRFGATVAAVLLTGELASIGHVGAERVYRFAEGMLEQLTEDHSLLTDYLRLKDWTPEEAADIRRRFPHKNVIVRALGVQPEVVVDCATEELGPGDVYLVVTRTLGDALGQDAMCEILSGGGGAAVIADRLLSAAVACAPHEDHAVIVIDAWRDLPRRDRSTESPGDGSGDTVAGAILRNLLEGIIDSRAARRAWPSAGVSQPAAWTYIDYFEDCERGHAVRDPRFEDAAIWPLVGLLLRDTNE